MSTCFMHIVQISTCFMHLVQMSTCFMHLVQMSTCFMHLVQMSTCFMQIVQMSTCFMHFVQMSTCFMHLVQMSTYFMHIVQMSTCFIQIIAVFTLGSCFRALAVNVVSDFLSSFGPLAVVFVSALVPKAKQTSIRHVCTNHQWYRYRGQFVVNRAVMMKEWPLYDHNKVQVVM